MTLKETAKALAGKVATVAAVFASAGIATLRPIDREASELAEGLRKCLNGEYSRLDWGGFVTQPIKDEHLDAIRLRAVGIEPPLSDEGRAILVQLLVELDEMDKEGSK